MKTFGMCVLFCTAALVCAAQSTGPQPKIENVTDMKLVTFPNVPTCFTAAVENGDPSSGPSTIFLKGTKGCDVPMHFHSVTEQVAMVSGTARLQMKGDLPRTVKAGAYAIAPARHPHHLTCSSACEMYVISDGPFDIHYIDDAGKEITFEQAIKPAAKPGRSSPY